MKEFVLYSYFRSSAAHRVRIALNLKRIDYEYRGVHLLNDGGEQNKPEYRKLNPSRQVPTLVHTTAKGTLVLGQSMAIMYYLDQINADSQLFPKDDVARQALIIQACEIVNSGTQPMVNIPVLSRLETQFGTDQSGKNEWAAHFIQRGLEALENFLEPHAGQYCFGNTITAADCFLIAQLTSSERFKISYAPYPTLIKVRDNCRHLDVFKRAAPDVQPDTPAAM